MKKRYYHQEHIKNLNSCGNCAHMKRYNCPTSYRNYPYEIDFLCKKFDFLIENAGNIHIQKSPYPICDSFTPIKMD
ncbi:hypothetical protein NEF87_000220 [Candidatus Lokiarchaeum ossiferum]|uniref:Uncharacterized protein n=1 Tax=Candidatus Lokiarchaeum ossiferum TaxID=2951803 RepID=A0ABY6HK87_9ARCH|nr:hypothetical protein NEF87_000220 [Candidatus Lokiarchaeum sp. B-35]